VACGWFGACRWFIILHREVSARFLDQRLGRTIHSATRAGAVKISVVVPVFEEGVLVRAVRDQIVQVFETDLKHHDYEIIFVDDGSQDNSIEHLAALAEADRRIKVIQFEQNCGSHMAVRAGLDFCTGDALFYVPCDMQESPGMLPKLLEFLQGPIQIVLAVRETRTDRLATRVGSRIFFALAHLLVSRDIPPSGSGSFLLGSRAIRCARLYQERNLSWDGLLASLPFPRARVPYERVDRIQGASKWTLEKRLKLFADFFVGFSYKPIRSMSYLGLATALAGFTYAIIVVFNRIVFSRAVEGWSSLMLVLLIVSGVQMVMLGIIGEYLWRTLDEARARPRYIVRRLLNLASDAAPPHQTVAGKLPPMSDSIEAEQAAGEETGGKRIEADAVIKA
jgi:polyisoprenyl-phosphate glycosyltransferase